MICWFFGRSGAGKTTLAASVAGRLRALGHAVCVIDGDQLRAGLCADLGFDPASRTENHRRAAELARLVTLQTPGVIVLGATMCPSPEHRALLRRTLGPALQLIQVRASHATCVARDPKGLYAKASWGLLADLDATTFQDPSADELRTQIHAVIDTDLKSATPEESCESAWEVVRALL